MFRLVAATVVSLVLVLVATPVAVAAEITGTDGDDVLVGSSGGDTISGLGGDDVLRGAGGDDLLDGGPGVDDLSGGPGEDAALYGDMLSPVTIALDDLANDGEVDEQDNVETDVEDLYGSAFGDRIVGSAGPNTIDGGDGADVIDGGGGLDQLFGATGEDRLSSRDGRRDVIDCGDGFDSVIADEFDRVVTCEVVDRAPAVARVDGTFSYEWTWTPALTFNTRLEIRDLNPRSATVELSCSGGGCPFHTRHVRSGRHVVLTGMLRRHGLKPGATLRIRLTAPGRIGKMARFKIRRAAGPTFQVYCLRGRAGRSSRGCPWLRSAGAPAALGRVPVTASASVG